MRFREALAKHLTRLMLGAVLVVLLAGHAGRVWHIPVVSALDAYLYDVRVRLSMPKTVDERVVIIDLDEKSLAEIGRWPWSRNVIANLVRKLTDEYKVSVLGFDVVFAEPDDSSGLKVLERIGREQLRTDTGYQETLKGLRSQLDYDALFAETLKGRPVVLGYYFSNLNDARKSGSLPSPVFGEGYFRGRGLVFPANWAGYGSNLPMFQAAALSGGHFNPLVDSDGVSRRVPLIVEHQGAYYEALSLAMLRVMLGKAELKPGFPDAQSGLEWLEVNTSRGRLEIPVDEMVAALIPYRGGERSFSYVSASDVLKGAVDPAVIRGRIALVGTTAPGLMDLRSTPVGATYPGVEIHANMVAGMLDGKIKQKPSYVVGAEIVQLLFMGGILALLLPVLSPVRSTVLTLGVMIAMLGFNYWLWQSANLVFPVAATLVLLVLLYGMNMSWGYFVESKIKRQFTQLFGQYVPPELVEEMAKDPEHYSMEGRNQELTVLFSDVRSFTTISEGLDPKELTQLMNEYLGAMTTIVRQRRGTLDKYIGDAIMAFWGAPVADAEHARNAVLTALDMQKAVRSLDAPFKARGWPELHIGVGVNTGIMTVGDMGSPVRQSYTVMGDAVNLGSRLEGITKQYGVGVIAGEGTKALVRDVVFRELDRVRVKGKDEPVGIYEPLGLAGELSQDEMDDLKLWNQALRLYRAQDWDQAELQLYNLQKRHPGCYLYQLYSERIGHLRSEPPGENWDGVTTFQTK